jgi:hypothetical protein
MQDPASELPRIPLLGNSVNRRARRRLEFLGTPALRCSAK